MKKKILIMAVAMALVCAFAVGMTVAYLTSNDTVTNTFTVGNVEIKLDEAPVNNLGEIQSGERVKANTYKLLPGHRYAKDPTVTVLNGSEESYVRMIVTITNATNIIKVFGTDFLPQNYVEGWDSINWPCVSMTNNAAVDDTIVLEFRYKETVTASNGDVELDDLFEYFTVPGTLTNAQIEKLNNTQINVVAEAIQADGFVDENGDPSADLAWNAFDQQ